MSLTFFLALCILGLDFMIYVLFKLFFSDRRSVIARRVAAQREAARAEAAGLIFVPAKKAAQSRPAPDRPAGFRASSIGARKLIPRDPYHTRIA
jgi:hypothetical protein